MLVTIPVVIYISFICWSYGSLLFHFLPKATRNKEPLVQSFAVTCFAGLAVIGTLFSGIALFTPVGDIVSHVTLLLPAIYWAFREREAISLGFGKVRAALTASPLSMLALLFSGIVLVLIMHSGAVNHPDTLVYHAQLIEWTKTYPAVPGIAHLNVNYGSQSSWFILSALFSFSFTGTTALTFINAAVLIWFILFIVQQINAAIKKEKGLLEGFLWLLLLMISLGSYTQVRLTASSASPDFIAALYVWLVFYLFTRPYKSASLIALIFFLSVFSMTIKLSALPCVMLGLYALFFSSIRLGVKIVLPVYMISLVLVPYLAKNVISTGYLLYPSVFPDWINVDWKMSRQTVAVFHDYIASYARTHVAYDQREIVSVMNMKLTEWLPAWWKLWSVADKIMLISIPVFFIVSLVFPARVFAPRNRLLLIALIFSFIGIVFWFLQAPDPRFGLGFIIPFCGIALYLLLHDSRKTALIKNGSLFFFSLLVSVTVLSYSAYRLTKHLAVYNLIQPAGVAPIPFTTVNCNGIDINIPVKGLESGSSPVPCTTKGCRDFIPRGKDIRQGFAPEY